MPTVIDALVMTFGLDGSDFKSSASQVKKDMKGVSDEAKKRAEETEANLKKMARGFEEAKKMAGGLFVLLAGATGITEFISQVVQAEAALGRLSTHTGSSTQELQAWGNVADLVGGKAEEMQQGMAGLAKQMVELKYKGEMSPTLIFFNQMGVALADSNGQMRTQSDLMLDLADRAKNMKKEDFYNLASSAGMNDSQIDTIMKGRGELEKMLKAQEANALTTKEQAEQARQLMAEWAELKQGVAALGRQILGDLIPILTVVFDTLQAGMNFLKQHRGFIYGFFIVLAAVMAPAVISATALVIQFGLLAAPIIAVAAAIGLLIDDFLTWKDGGDSFLPWDTWSEEIDSAVEGIQRLIKNLGNLGGAVDAIKNGDFKGAWSIIQESVAEGFNGSAAQPKDVTPKPGGQPASPKSVQSDSPSWSEQLMEKGGALFGDIKQSLGMSGGKAVNVKGLNKDKKAAISRVAKNIGVNPNDLAAVISFETSGTFSPSIKNPKSSATGLIQFMKGSGGTKGKYYGMSRDKFAGLSFDEQMTYVERYFKERGFSSNKPQDVASLYGAVTGYGYKKGSAAYDLNKVWDSNGNDIIEKGEMVKNPKFRAHQKNYFGGEVQVPQGAGARAQGALGNNMTSQNSTHVDTTIGEVNIYTAATDVAGIAGAIKPAIENTLAFNTHAVDTGLS